jgi:hypothetical protein
MRESPVDEQLASRLLALCQEAEDVCLVLRQVVARCDARADPDAEQAELCHTLARALEAVARAEQAVRAAAARTAAARPRV